MVKVDDSIPSEDIYEYHKNDKCAPGNDLRDGSCMPVEVLVEMANAYNLEFDDKIKLHPNMETVNPSKYKRYLIKNFGKRLGNICDSQRCWVKQKFVNKMKHEYKVYARKHAFRPDGPGGKFTWLNTFNINDVMEQYQNKYPEFQFMGAVPIDFDDLPQLGIAGMDLDQMVKNGKTKLGFVFNLDEHYKNGSHWVGMYTDLKKGGVYFFDSYGIEPNERIRKLMRRIGRYCEKNTKVTSRYNKVRHQFGGSECGVYSMNFIIRMLNGESFDQITNNPTSDDDINKCREVYFHEPVK